MYDYENMDIEFISDYEIVENENNGVDCELVKESMEKGPLPEIYGSKIN